MDPTQIAVIVTGLATLGGVVVALLKLRPERDSISVKVAEGALKVQVMVVDEMEDALGRLREDLGRLTTEVGQLRSELLTVTRERDVLSAENHDLRARVTHLEAEVTRLSNGH